MWALDQTQFREFAPQQKFVRCGACGTLSKVNQEALRPARPSGVRAVYDAAQHLLEESRRRFCSADDVTTPKRQTINHRLKMVPAIEELTNENSPSEAHLKINHFHAAVSVESLLHQQQQQKREDTPVPTVRLRNPSGRTVPSKSKPPIQDKFEKRKRKEKDRDRISSNRSSHNSWRSSTVFSTSCPESTRTSADESQGSISRTASRIMPTSMENLVLELDTNLRDSLSERERKIRKFKKRMLRQKKAEVIPTEKVHPLSDLIDRSRSDNVKLRVSRPNTFVATSTNSITEVDIDLTPDEEEEEEVPNTFERGTADGSSFRTEKLLDPKNPEQQVTHF
ncbi:hypothetical protein Ciccas_010583 [Cichlidogyrus casuarinus]|uniref:Uncharacterized protein n=1 Tax=Cichlidogyrus casuarinus TaxID=1844966 RepID=A0ABD2PTQ6_9PLAT